ncbi:hypothetical protein BLNAU_11199 [Blattamonas nauphoetae]|uniref:Uncharacterized protein n=1 Tax=Blattamonas nauphoetae TaxID=2049346 RepID=A0ABQ9XN06_9EUKA|nr:hypothetical protein BLNAU_11199 [Blattamonas nauphoetae]
MPLHVAINEHSHSSLRLSLHTTESPTSSNSKPLRCSLHHSLRNSLSSISPLFTPDSPLIVCVCSCFCVWRSLDRDFSVASCPSSHHTAPMHGVSESDDVMCVRPDSQQQRRRRGNSPGRLGRCSVCLSERRRGWLWRRVRGQLVINCGVVGESDEMRH